MLIFMTSLMIYSAKENSKIDMKYLKSVLPLHRKKLGKYCVIFF